MKRDLHLGLQIGIAVLLSACTTETSQTSFSERKATKDIAVGLDGIWQSDGYGFVFDINDGKITGYDATSDICVSFGDEAFPVHDVYGEYQIASDEKTVLYYETGEIYPYKYTKLDAIPLPCQNPAQDTPLSNFNAFVSFFDEHYAFFDLYNVDWQVSAYSVRERITDQTTDAELFDVFKSLLSPIKDAHVNIHAELDSGSERWNAKPEKIARFINERAKRKNISIGKSAAKFYNGYWLENIHRAILKDEGVFAANKRIQYGMASDKFGYIAILSEGSFTDETFDTDIAALNDAMDGFMALIEKNNAQSVIVDLSVNFGGRGKIARAIASRFAKAETAVYSKYAADRQDKQSITYIIQPHSGPRFLGPVYLVTSNATLSAGEELTLAMRSLENVTHFGEPTRGALSDKLSKSLPNGWEITLSNEVYTDVEGEVWEGRGIRPKQNRVVFDPKSPLKSHQSLILELVNRD